MLSTRLPHQVHKVYVGNLPGASQSVLNVRVSQGKSVRVMPGGAVTQMNKDKSGHIPNVNKVSKIRFYNFRNFFKNPNSSPLLLSPTTRMMILCMAQGHQLVKHAKSLYPSALIAARADL